jgi:hypothetical protein
MERKIEQILSSPDPAGAFNRRGVDPQRFVDRVAWTIADVGDEVALAQIAKLSRIDENRFGGLVAVALDHSMRWRNPFAVAYGGLAVGDPALDARIIAWAGNNLSIDPEERARADEAARGYGPTPPPPAEKMKHLWAEAIVDRYSGLPTGAQWASDPIASRLGARLTESLRSDVLRYAQEALERRPQK